MFYIGDGLYELLHAFQTISVSHLHMSELLLEFVCMNAWFLAGSWYPVAGSGDRPTQSRFYVVFKGSKAG